MVCIDILVLQAATLAADTADTVVSVSDTAVAVVVESIVAVV